MKVSSVQEMREMDRRAIEEFGLPDVILMENAGNAVHAVILQEMGIREKRFVCFCGTGNNGGDGFVVARKIHSMGGSVCVFLLGDREKYKGAALSNLDILTRLHIETQSITNSVAQAREALKRCDAVIDAVFGTGLARNVENIHREVIELINSCGKPVFSIDIPSGINGNTGCRMGASVKANHTVTFGTPKLGNVLYPGFECCGKLWLTRISFPPLLHENADILTEISIPARLPPRKPDGHKGDFGDALFIAGATNYYGAPLFSALSFLKAGGGYSRLAAPQSVTPFVATRGNEIVFVPLDETETGSLSLKSEQTLCDLSEKVDLVVIGPGISLNTETQALVRNLLQSVKKPVVLDGDGITAVADHTEILKNRTHPTVVTPHPGEMSRIANKPVSEIAGDRIGSLRELSQTLGVIVVLKGAHTLVGFADGKIFVNMSGNSGMATAGSGDTLTGTIAAMFGLGLSLENAVKTGVFLHGLSGDLAAVETGEDGMTARDILESLPRTVKYYRSAYDRIVENSCGAIFLV
jgi:NAD(P)H-hydrate epimerase